MGSSFVGITIAGAVGSRRRVTLPSVSTACMFVPSAGGLAIPSVIAVRETGRALARARQKSDYPESIQAWSRLARSQANRPTTWATLFLQFALMRMAFPQPRNWPPHVCSVRFVSFSQLRELSAHLPADSVGAHQVNLLLPLDPNLLLPEPTCTTTKLGFDPISFPFLSRHNCLHGCWHQSFGTLVFLQLGFFFNLQAPVHSDRNNDHRHCNLLLPGSHFSDGQIWVEGKGEHPCPDASTKRLGYLLDVAKGPQRLPSERLHATCAWTGDRLLVVGFCVRDTARRDRQRLLDCGFHVPDHNPPIFMPSVQVTPSTSASSPSAMTSAPTPPCSDGTPSATSDLKRRRVAYRPAQPLAATRSSSLSSCPPSLSTSTPSLTTCQKLFPHELAPLVIEVFAGTARLSTVAGRMGFRTLAVDRSSRRSSFAIQKLDLTQEHDVQTLLDIINLEAHNIAWIHLAPPCGTASAARSRLHVMAVQYRSRYGAHVSHKVCPL